MYVRKNAASLTAEEWARFLNAIVTLKHTFPPDSNVSVYDQFVAIHLGVVQLRWGTGPAAGVDGAHQGPAFLPWHREYIRRYEAALGAVDSRVTLPYWNWGLGAVSETTALFQDDHMGPMGAGGAPFEVDTGYFALNPNTFNPLGWSIRPELRPLGETLQRNNTLSTVAGWPTPTSVANTLAQGAYHLFRPSLEAAPHHNGIHVRMGRDMAQMTSPNDPIFFLHHCQVDRIWAKWQEDHPGSANYNPLGTGGYGHRLTDRMWPWDGGQSSPGDWPGNLPSVAALVGDFPETDVVTPQDMLDHRALGYCYDDEPDCPCPPVIKKEDKEKVEIKEWLPKEKLETKERLPKEFKEPKEIFERFPRRGNVPAEERLANLEANVEELTHFITSELRPDLTRGALSREEQ